MFTQRERVAEAREAEAEPTMLFEEDPKRGQSSPEEEVRHRHDVLMENLEDERERQNEERMQAAMDEDFYDHLQWRQEDALVLMNRGQAPLVFNESRQTIDWIAGTQKRMRKDYKILGREEKDQQGAPVITQVVKYTDDANLTEWHVSRGFKQAALSGLSWLEEGVNPEPGEELIYSGSEDWRNVYRDSRSRMFDLKNARYLFRRKVIDLDYALALFPKKAEPLRQEAAAVDTVDDTDIWYLGERLTGASDMQGANGLPMAWRDRSMVIGNDYTDKGRRQSVAMLECYYRVPKTVEVWDDGPLVGQVFNEFDRGHVQLKQDKWPCYQTVKLVMRTMIATEAHPLWDGLSPFRHGRFPLIPIWGYRRYRDGMAYGVMRGMRDLQEDSNKRASKAQWLLASNQIITPKGAFDDIETVREEAAAADGIIEYDSTQTGVHKPEFVVKTADIQTNLLMMDRNLQAMRDIGGVTNENLGRDTNAQSGVAIERKQDQGSLTTSELPDNLLLARKLAGQQRLSNIKQFMTRERVIRVVGEGQPVDWLPINKPDPQNPNAYLNDIAEITCDYIVAEQDYRESYVRAATAEMFELLGQIATFAPQVVLSVLDLAVDGSEVRNKDEWVARIREINGQRDPTKKMTPQEEAQKFAQQQKQMLADKLQMDTLQAQLAKLQAEVEKLSTDAMAKRTDSLMAALQAAQLVATQPMIAPVADEISQAAGFVPQNTAGPELQAPAQALPVPQADPNAPPAGAQPPMGMPSEPDQAAGVDQGIQPLPGG